MGYGYLMVSRNGEAERAFQDAASTFRRYEMRFALATALNDYGVLMKRTGDYLAARQMLLEARSEFSRLGTSRNTLFVTNNLGYLALRTGNWRAAEKHFTRAEAILANDGLGAFGDQDTQLRCSCMTGIEHLHLMRRRFSRAEMRLRELGSRQLELKAFWRFGALTHEYLGELYTETEQFDKARQHLGEAESITLTMLPKSDVMTEILRRQAQLHLCGGEYEQAKGKALQCIQLSKQITDRYELGAATRVLGEVYAARGDAKRAKSCFSAAVHMLKTIHECYELMRSLYAQGRFLNEQGQRDDAEVSLLEARQLTRKLELDYYQARVAIALIDTVMPQERWEEANAWLVEATSLRDGLDGIDRDRVSRELERAAGELQQAITRASVREAESIKTICRVYEDARFPIAELKPDLAYQVAQSVGGESLFVIGRRGGGFHVPLTYNIPINEAKEIIRQLDTAPKKPLFGLKSEPKVLTTRAGRTLVAVPCHTEASAKDEDPAPYVVCTRFEQVVTVSPRQMELLCASAEALARLIEDDGGRHLPPASAEEVEKAKHPRGSFKDILTIDPEMIKVIRLAERAATSVAPILLEGETGVGKELFARAIHGASRRKEASFVAVNAGGMSVPLLESELFGHVKGAFTDASNDRVGLIDMARGGTLFLDEVGEMGEELQVKLLRLMENGEYRRLGESAVRTAEVRVISATNRDLKSDAEKGSFRRDLFYRISPVRITIPPLRMRSRDIQLLVRRFLRECAAMNGISDRYIEIDVKAMEALELYHWPGNVRELHNEILRVVSLIGKGSLVRFPMLSESIKDYLKGRNRGDGLLDRSVEQYERRLILSALENHDWNRMRTADAIGVPRTTLLAKLKRLNIASK
jgi:DNA-binding NtrC family response regulator/tetratricopeptide (TPR) repeat protein